MRRTYFIYVDFSKCFRAFSVTIVSVQHGLNEGLGQASFLHWYHRVWILCIYLRISITPGCDESPIHFYINPSPAGYRSEDRSFAEAKLLTNSINFSKYAVERMYSATLTFLATAIFILTWSRVSGNIFETTARPCAGQICPKQEKICINIGGEEETIGPYLGDKGLVTYIRKGQPSRTNFYWKQKLKKDANILAYARQRINEKEFSFRVAVDKRFAYKLTFGFICIGGCPHNKGNTTIIVNDKESAKVDVPHVSTSNKPTHSSVLNVRPNGNGNIDVKLRHPKIAALATLCIEDEPITSPECFDNNCQNFFGKYRYSTTHGSLFEKSGNSCFYKKKSFSNTRLVIPKSASIVDAFLTWSAVGTPAKSRTTIKLEDVEVSATWVEASAGYLAQASVSEIVANTLSGSYSVEDMEHDEDDRCDFGYASWTLVVIYEEKQFSKTNINLCAFGHVSQFSVPCLVPNVSRKTHLFMAVTQTDKSEKDDDLFINDKLVQEDVYDEKSGSALDIYERDVTSFIQESQKLEIRDSQPDERHIYLTVVTSETI